MNIEQKYSVNHYLGSEIRNYVYNKEIAILENPRTFLKVYYKSLKPD